jgi:hypothetical protein
MENGRWEMGDAKPRSQDNGDHSGDGQRGPKHSILRVRYVTSGRYACVVVRMLWKE